LKQEANAESRESGEKLLDKRKVKNNDVQAARRQTNVHLVEAPRANEQWN
jgi:hypothetical protein